MLANVFFRNEFSQINGGIKPQTLATGTTSGNAIQLGGVAPIGKLLFMAQASMLASATSNSGAMSMWLATCTASGGTFVSISQTQVSTSIGSASTNSGSQFTLMIDTRNEAFCNLGTNALWVMPVVALATAAVPFALTVLGWQAGTDPASNYDVGVITAETDFY
jgi:hypothetical protein